MKLKLNYKITKMKQIVEILTIVYTVNPYVVFDVAREAHAWCVQQFYGIVIHLHGHPTSKCIANAKTCTKKKRGPFLDSHNYGYPVCVCV